MGRMWFLLTFILSVAVVLHGASEMEIELLLSKINKPAVKTILSPDGDVIDCVKIEKQLAFDNPLLQSSNLQMSRPENLISSMRSKAYRRVPRQVWHRAGQRCPNGTIPVRRTIQSDLIRASSLETYGRKTYHRSSYHRGIGSSIKAADATGHEYAVARVVGEFTGGKAILNVWSPVVEGDYEMSLSQMWVVAGGGDNLNTLEAGWQVHPSLYKDRKSRLFVYWTSDNYGQTGCHNVMCPGFVQTSPNVLVGGAIDGISSLNGPQYEMEVFVSKDESTGNWWLHVGDEPVGYWPREILSALATGNANTVQWGGEIVNNRPDGEHTKTEMGSGQHPELGYGQACYLKGLQVVDANNNVRTPQEIGVQSDFPDCYGISPPDSRLLFFGGPGHSLSCP